MKCFFCNQKLIKNRWGHQCTHLCFNPECIIDDTFIRHMITIIDEKVTNVRFLFPAKNGTYGVYQGDNYNETIVRLIGEGSIKAELVINMKLNSGNDAIRAVKRFKMLLPFS